MGKKIDVKEKDLSVKNMVNWRILLAFFVVLAIIFIAVGATYFIEKSLYDGKLEVRLNEIEPIDIPSTFTNLDSEDSEESEKESENKISFIKIEKDPAFDGASFSEELTKLGGQNSYISAPLVVNEDDLPPMIIYSHGSNTLIADHMDTTFMDDMRSYGEFFTDKNFIFAASNQHGENWGNAESLKDTENLIEYINEEYVTNGEIYMIGYSMGGLPTWNYMFKHPDSVAKAALLAPTSYSSNYTKENFDSIKDVDVKIWHGTADSNIDISMSIGLVRRANLFGKNIVLVQLQGKDHWQVDTELQDDIYEFFTE